MNKKSIKYALYVTICSLAMVVLTGLGLRGVKAESLTADLDGDGKKDVIEWDLSWDDVWGDVLSELTINGKDVYKETKSDVIISEFYDYYVYVADTCTADKYKELVISTDRSEVLHIIRYRKGKIYKPITISGSSIVEQKKKNVINVHVKNLVQLDNH